MSWQEPKPSNRSDYYMLAKEAVREWDSLDKDQQAYAMMMDEEAYAFVLWCKDLVEEVELEEEERYTYHQLNMSAFRRK